MTSIMTKDDVKAMREEYFVDLDFATDEQLIEAFDGKDSVVWLARQWTWDDTEVRDDSAAVLKKYFKANDIMDLASSKQNNNDSNESKVVETSSDSLPPEYNSDTNTYEIKLNNDGVKYAVNVVLPPDYSGDADERDRLLLSTAISDIERNLVSLKRRYAGFLSE